MATKTFPTDFTTKANPVDADLLLIADTEDSNNTKKITIGSITADIGDGLIVDGSASTTTTYSSTKIAADNATQDSALTSGLALKVAKSGDNMTGLFKEAQGATIASATTTDLSVASGNSITISGTTTITGLGTVQAGTTIKVTFSGALILTHNATSLILPNAGTDITTATGDSAIFTSLGSGNWKCLNYTRVDGTSLAAVSVVGLTEDTSGDMDADFLLAYDNSATANRKQKMNVYRATQAEAAARTSTTKFVPPAYLPQHTGGVFTKDLTEANGATTVIAHSLPAAPVKVRLTSRIGSASFTTATSDGSWDASGQRCVFTGANNATDRSATSATYAIYIVGTNATLVSQAGTVTVDATNITITWTKTNAPTGSAFCTWDANT